MNHDLGQRCSAVADRNSVADHHPAGAVLALTSIDDTGRVRSRVIPDALAFSVFHLDVPIQFSNSRSHRVSSAVRTRSIKRHARHASSLADLRRRAAFLFVSSLFQVREAERREAFLGFALRRRALCERTPACRRSTAAIFGARDRNLQRRMGGPSTSGSGRVRVPSSATHQPTQGQPRIVGTDGDPGLPGPCLRDRGAGAAPCSTIRSPHDSALDRAKRDQYGGGFQTGDRFFIRQ